MKKTLTVAVILIVSIFCQFANSKGVEELPGSAQGVNAAVAKQIQTAWNKLEREYKGRSFYISRVSPPFPLNGEKIYYVYAAGIGEVGDGEKIKGIWGRVVEKGNEQRFEELIGSFDKIKDVGIQGVRPVETKPANKGELNYCDWIKGNKVISDEIMPMHKDYFSSLKCSAAK